MAGSTARKLKLIAGLLGVVLAGYVVGTAIDRARLPGVDLDQTSNLVDLRTGSDAPATGNANARVTVVVFTDYQCAVCRIDHDGIAGTAAASAGVRFVFKEWAILGSASRRAARVALAAGYQGRYLQARDALMRVKVSDQEFMASGLGSAGVDLARLERDLARFGGAIDRELARTSSQAFSLGLAGTPAYLIGRRLVIGRLTKSKLERLIARAESAP
jgi:protein-disulfide isomerase